MPSETLVNIDRLEPHTTMLSSFIVCYQPEINAGACSTADSTFSIMILIIGINELTLFY